MPQPHIYCTDTWILSIFSFDSWQESKWACFPKCQTAPSGCFRLHVKTLILYKSFTELVQIYEEKRLLFMNCQYSFQEFTLKTKQTLWKVCTLKPNENQQIWKIKQVACQSFCRTNYTRFKSVSTWFLAKCQGRVLSCQSKLLNHLLRKKILFMFKKR